MGCLEANMIGAKIAALLAKDGGQTYVSIILTDIDERRRVVVRGSRDYECSGYINVTFRGDHLSHLFTRNCL